MTAADDEPGTIGRARVKSAESGRGGLARTAICQREATLVSQSDCGAFSRLERAIGQRCSSVRWFAFALILVVAAVPDSSSAAGRVFFDDFESYSVGTIPAKSWSQDPPHPLPDVVADALDGGPGPVSGTKMLRTNWNEGDYSGVTLTSWSYTNEFLIRFWFRTDADVDRKPGSKSFRLLNPSGRESYFHTPQMEIDGGIFSFWEEIDGSSSVCCGRRSFGETAPTPLGNGHWHKIEIYVKHNTTGQTNGILRVWQDGVLIHEVINSKTVTDGNKWYPMYVMSNWSMNPGWEHDSSNHVYWDDFEIYSDTGAGATGSMSDATICAGQSCNLPRPRLRLID